MTDSEIVKALECCIKSSHFGECFDNKCPLVSEQGCKVGKETLYPYALDLINRLQAKVNRLESKNSELEYDLSLLRQEREGVVKAEAYKEFAERLDNEFKGMAMCNHGWVKNKIKLVLKELVGEDNE